jgi:hypothetical protein
MIPFFRKIRKKMADDNRPLKYMRYAVGEIVLVVAGILIALQINNWNEERKDNKKLKMYVKDLVSDLEKDTINLNDWIRWSKKEIDKLKEIDEYINNPDSMITIDSIINIVPNINFGNSGPGPLNQETFNTLVSTGDVGLIPERQMNELKSLNFRYKDFENGTESNMKFIFEFLMTYLNSYRFVSNEEKNSLVYLSQMKNFDEAEFLRTLDNYVGNKIFLYGIISSHTQNVLKYSEQTLASLKDL